jgi:uncharacterized protein YecT (DUF1311 family)
MVQQALLLTIGLMAGTPAMAADCNNPPDQNTMNQCAEGSYRTADKILNTQYKTTRKVLADTDAEAERLLLTAQKAWIAYRDAHCDTVAFTNKGGSMEPTVRFGCMTDVTAARTQDLKELAKEYGQ